MRPAAPILSFSQVQSLLRDDRDSFDAALSLLTLPPAARRIIPRSQPKRVAIRVRDNDSRARVERRWGA